MIEIVAQKMGGLLKRGELTDMVLVASDGHELSAHRSILGAYSQVKYSMYKISHNIKKIIIVN
jgi:hypothetical protein